MLVKGSLGKKGIFELLEISKWKDKAVPDGLMVKNSLKTVGDFQEEGRRRVLRVL